MRSKVAVTCVAIVLTVLVPAASAETDLVAVDERDLGAYWRTAAAARETVSVTAEGLSLYGCMAVPFTIHPDGRVEIGLRPLLSRLGTGGRVTVDVEDLYPLAVGALPRFEPTWDRQLDSSILSSYSVVLVDAATRSRLGKEKWSRLEGELRKSCQIQDLGDWVQRRNPGDTVEQRLPADPEDTPLD